MKSSNFKNSKESSEAKKELEKLAKQSKKEYQDSKASIKKRAGTHTVLVPQKILLKGEEVLGVVGNERRRSSFLQKSKDQPLKATNARSKPGTDSSLEPAISKIPPRPDVKNLSVVMKGERLLKERNETRQPSYDLQVFVMLRFNTCQFDNVFDNQIMHTTSFVIKYFILSCH